jgi:hypothetical protein
MWLNIVTDDQLLASQIVKTILLLVISGGILFNIYRLVKFVSKRKRAINLSILIILCLALIFVVRVYLIEFALLKSPVYVTGTTIGNCNVFAEGRGIEFEYEVNGKKFRGGGIGYGPVIVFPTKEEWILIKGPINKYLQQSS